MTGNEIPRILRARTSALSPSWYDTAQVVHTWLRHPRALPASVAGPGLDRLLRAQHPDGSWGVPVAPPGYRVVPTLAAAAALLAARTRSPRAAPAADAALGFLLHLPKTLAPETLPDTIAVELIVPALLENIAAQLRPTHFAHDFVRAAARRHDPAALRRLRAAAAGATLPPRAYHSMEVLTGPPNGYRLVDGSVACSPAATAAALSWRPSREAEEYLRSEGLRLAGAWPTVAPVRTFEVAWLVGAAARLGMTMPAAAADQVGRWLAAQLGADGCGAGPALAPDSDDTAIVLFALHALGHPWHPRHLWPYEEDTHFATFPGERTVSSSTNAHVLEVLLAAHQDGRTLRGITKVVTYLLDSQHADGHWDDKWHASPCYATTSAALALRGVPLANGAVERAVRWVLEHQRADGSWGCWIGTREETAHTLHLLLTTPGHDEATASGIRYLRTAEPAPVPLWHGKELYEPERIVETLVRMTLEHATTATRS
jgi:halimadienyl-diphosphate synthase